jgi:hypothetical protein
LHQLYRAMAWLGEPLDKSTSASGYGLRTRKDVMSPPV